MIKVGEEDKYMNEINNTSQKGLNEIWKDVKGYEGLYVVSNLGRVKSIERYVKGRGNGLHKAGGGFMKLFNRSKYIGVTLCKCNKAIQFYLHRIVADAFIPNPEGNKEVNHIDGNKHNNKVSNLEWVSHSENGKHAYRIGLKVKKGGTPNKRVRVFAEGIDKKFNSIADAASYFSISQSSISRCCSGERKYFRKIYKAEYI